MTKSNMTIKQMKSPEVKMPKTEADFLKHLVERFRKSKRDDIVLGQYPIDNCPFVSSGKHKVDFYIREPELYIEVKGMLSYYSVNELEYLLLYSGKPFYVLQVTNEDWMGAYNPDRDGSTTKKIEDNRTKQYKEVEEFLAGKISAKVMTERSLKRLKEFKKLRKGDVERWRKMAKK